MSDFLSVTRNKGNCTESLLHDARRLFVTIRNLLDSTLGADPELSERLDCCLMHSSMGELIADEALRAWERERAR